MMQYNKPYSFEKTDVRWGVFKIFSTQNFNRSTELGMFYSPCYGIVLMCYNRIRVAEIFKQAGETAIIEKLHIEKKLNYEKQKR